MKPKSELIRRFILNHIEEHPRDIANLTAKKFEMTRQAVNRHMRMLIANGLIEAKGKTSDRTYSLVVTKTSFKFDLKDNKEEHLIWEEDIEPLLTDVKFEVFKILQYGFTEMFNNVIDHSGGSIAIVVTSMTANTIRIHIADDGIGIFEKIKTRFVLNDHREALLELSKGKLTTDPTNHSGQGIFFTSRMFDKFSIVADHLVFIHNQDYNGDDDWLFELAPRSKPGTSVFMEISLVSERTTKEVFDRYTDLESGDYAFSKTHVPVSLARYPGELLVSRSQAKRVLSRFERFKEVFLDFSHVESIGQSFADEIFRVFSNKHPEIKIIVTNANQAVQNMISRAKSPDTAS